MNFCLCWISFFRSSQFIRLITSVLVKLLSYRSFNGTACSLRAPAVLDRILRTMAVAALHDNCSRDTVRGTGPHHLGLLHRHCFHDMEQKQADDAGPKQTTVAQWVFWILKMHLNYFWITTHSTLVLWAQSMTRLYCPAEWCCNAGCGTYFVSEDGLRCKYSS